jgi:type IV pilus assembly protein PilX
MPYKPSARPARPARGVSLIIVLVFITILSGIGAFAVRRAVFGEGLARNMLDTEVARQAAEAALRDAERDLNNVTQGVPVCSRGDDRPFDIYGRAFISPHFDTTCPRGQCRYDNPTAYYTASNFVTGTNPEPWWPTTSITTTSWNNTASTKPPSGSCSFVGGVPLGTFTWAAAIRGVSRQPEYLIEYMKRGTDVYFRITSRGWGLDPNSEIVLQSYFRPEG